jgi:tetratricopeptide (TPR) repeat protein
LTTKDWREQVDELLERADRLRHGEAKVMALEEAARMADAHGDLDLAFEVRDDLIDAATFGGFPDKALVAFAWCRAQAKKNPERFESDMLLWKQKWVVGRLDDFPHISRKQIQDALDDIEQAYARVDAGKRAILKLRYQTARDMGEDALAQQYWDQWINAPRDHLTDCRACDLDDEIDHHIDLGEYAKALEKARPILQGRSSCAEIPHLTYGSVLYPLLKLGRLEEARDCHLRGYPMISRNRDFLATVGEHIEFLALTDNLSRGLTLFEKHLGWALDHASWRDRFTFHVAASFLLARLVSQGHDTVSLRLPKAFPLHQRDGAYTSRDLHGWVETQAQEIAARFDTRNGTDRFQKLLERTRSLDRDVHPFPIQASERVG